MTFQTAAGDVQCQPIVIVLDSVVETADEVFLVDIDLPPTGRIQAGNPDQTMVSIQGRTWLQCTCMCVQGQ